MKWSRKSQTSVEFLVVYSWILIGVIASISVMYSFGIFDATFASPEECSFNKQFLCEDFTLRESTSTIILKLRNNAGEDLETVAVGTDIRDVEDPTFTCLAPAAQTWNNGAIINLIFSGCSGDSFSIRETMKLEVTIEYFSSDSPSLTTHLLVGNLKGRVVS